MNEKAPVFDLTLRSNIEKSKAYEKLLLTMQEEGSYQYCYTICVIILKTVPNDITDPLGWIYEHLSYFGEVLKFTSSSYWKDLYDRGLLEENASSCAKTQAQKNSGMMFFKTVELLLQYIYNNSQVKPKWSFAEASMELTRDDKIKFICEHTKFSPEKLSQLEDKEINRRYKQVNRDIELLD